MKYIAIGLVFLWVTGSAARAEYGGGAANASSSSNGQMPTAPSASTAGNQAPQFASPNPSAPAASGDALENHPPLGGPSSGGAMPGSTPGPPVTSPAPQPPASAAPAQPLESHAPQGSSRGEDAPASSFHRLPRASVNPWTTSQDQLRFLHARELRGDFSAKFAANHRARIRALLDRYNIENESDVSRLSPAQLMAFKRALRSEASAINASEKF